jgi:hypothetical protein
MARCRKFAGEARVPLQVGYFERYPACIQVSQLRLLFKIIARHRQRFDPAQGVLAFMPEHKHLRPRSRRSRLAAPLSASAPFRPSHAAHPGAPRIHSGASPLREVALPTSSAPAPFHFRGSITHPAQFVVYTSWPRSPTLLTQHARTLNRGAPPLTRAGHSAPGRVSFA